MRIVYDGKCSGKHNMKKDEILLKEAVIYGKFPILRFYEWSELTLSIGFNQKYEDFNVCIPVVKRPTGGRALLHGWDISFSLVDSKGRWGKGPSEIYRRFAGILREIFLTLGIETEIVRSGRRGFKKYCMLAPSYGEIVFNGRKIIAYATKFEQDCLLLQGSVYLQFDIKRASEILRLDNNLLYESIIPLSEMDVGKEEFISAFENVINRLYCSSSLIT